MRKRLLPNVALVLSAVAISAGIAIGSGMFLPLVAQVQNGNLGGAGLPSCGNGTCDTGETDTGYGGSMCFQDCSCGDGRCDAHEMPGSGMHCPMDCGDVCGDGTFGMTEECEDGNKLNGDGCDMDCKHECGDGRRDTNPSDGYSEVCDGEFGCVNDCQFMEDTGMLAETSTGSTICKPFEPAFNDINADRVNVVFVGAGISGTGELVNAIEIASNHIFSLEPFASAKDKLQFWYADEIKPLGPGKDDYTKSCLESCASDVSCPELGKQYVNVLCNRECLSHADLDGQAQISYPDLKDNAGTFAHEFGHQFGELPDEYVKEGITGEWTKRPSCAPSLEKAREWWGTLVGDEDPILGPVGYYKGCSYDDTNYRPDLGPGNVMFVGAPWARYGSLIHQPYIKKKLDTYTGNTPRDTEPASDVTQENETWTHANFSNGETALRMMFERQGDGKYAIMGAEMVRVPYAVKPTVQSGMAVSVKADGKTYTQTFSPETISISEEFSDPNDIHFGSITKTPLQTVTVDIGLGDTPPDTDISNFVTLVAPCDDNDESDANDCPPPMYQGKPMAEAGVLAASSASAGLPSSSSFAGAITSSSASFVAVSPLLVVPSAMSRSSAVVSSASSSFSFVSSAASSQSGVMVHAAASESGMGWGIILLTILIGLFLGGFADYAWSRKKIKE